MSDKHSGESEPHEHDVSCAFGNPTCPEFGQPKCWSKTGWLSGQTYCGYHGRAAGWPCSHGTSPDKTER